MMILNEAKNPYFNRTIFCTNDGNKIQTTCKNSKRNEEFEPKHIKDILSKMGLPIQDKKQ